jgi:signal transduction histidine kinase
MLAFFFGLRAGIAGSAIAFVSILAFQAIAGFVGDLWLLMVQAGGVLMHGPLIGFLTDRERARAEELKRAHDRIAEANQRLIEEQSKLVQAEKLSSIGLLAAGVAHEINNPLSGVMGCCKALRESNLGPERREEYFEAIRDGLERIRVTVHGLLDFARQRPPLPTDQDASEVVASCLRLLQPLQRKKDLRVENRIPPGQVHVHADRTQFMQAVVNVLMNAIQAVPAQGHIAVTSRLERGQVGVCIADDGGGISKENLAHVCDPFFTTKPPGEGTGLGLAITLGIARAHGGDLSIDSEVGKGTRVTLWLPAETERRLDA